MIWWSLDEITDCSFTSQICITNVNTPTSKDRMESLIILTDDSINTNTAGKNRMVITTEH